MSNIKIKQVHDSFWTIGIGDVVLGTIHTESKLFSKKVLFKARSTFKVQDGTKFRGQVWGGTFDTFDEAEVYVLDLIRQLTELLTGE